MKALRHALSSHTHTHQLMGSVQFQTHTKSSRRAVTQNRAFTVTQTRAFILVGFLLPLCSVCAARRPAVRLDGAWNSIDE